MKQPFYILQEKIRYENSDSDVTYHEELSINGNDMSHSNFVRYGNLFAILRYFSPPKAGMKPMVIWRLYKRYVPYGSNGTFIIYDNVWNRQASQNRQTFLKYSECLAACEQLMLKEYSEL